MTWTHVVRLLSVENGLARQFYAKQCALDGWSTRELDRQVSSMLFERLALSTDKHGVMGMENLVLAGRFALQLPDPAQLSAAVAEVLREVDDRARQDAP